MPVTRDVIAIDTAALGTVYVPKFSMFMMRAIMQRAEELYPLPDPKPYEQPMPDAVIEGDVIPASQNPEYTKLLSNVMLKRNQHLQNAIISGLQLPENCTREEVIAAYKTNLDQLREYASLPDDDFVAIMRNCILSPEEYRDIVTAATKEQPLTQEEIRANLRIFRIEIQQRAPSGDHRKKGTPDIPEGEQVPA